MPSTKKKLTLPPAPPPPTATNGPATEVLTLAEAAAYLRLSEADVLDLVHSQNLPGRFTGSEWRFLKAALQQWLSTGSPTVQARKEAQLALAGKYKDDSDLRRICDEAYRKRGRPRPPSDSIRPCAANGGISDHR
jgi:excisionase family DNA binding protein